MRTGTNICELLFQQSDECMRYKVLIPRQLHCLHNGKKYRYIMLSLCKHIKHVCLSICSVSRIMSSDIQKTNTQHEISTYAYYVTSMNCHTMHLHNTHSTALQSISLKLVILMVNWSCSMRPIILIDSVNQES